jgi:hypothetical protein
MSTTSRRGGKRLLLCVVVIVAVAGLVMPAAAMAAVRSSRPVSPQRLELIERLAQHTPSDVAATTARGGSVDGVFKLSRFVRRQGQLVALGTFRGTVEDPRLPARTEQVAQRVPQRVAIPLGQLNRVGVAARPLCRVGQIRLNGTLLIELLGIHITLRSLHLDIQADPRSLLGSILCSLVRGPGTP